VDLLIVIGFVFLNAHGHFFCGFLANSNRRLGPCHVCGVDLTFGREEYRVLK
jgi:hypothetical protein